MVGHFISGAKLGVLAITIGANDSTLVLNDHHLTSGDFFFA